MTAASVQLARAQESRAARAQRPQCLKNGASTSPEVIGEEEEHRGKHAHDRPSGGAMGGQYQRRQNENQKGGDT
jgi:hypothetical protein